MKFTKGFSETLEPRQCEILRLYAEFGKTAYIATLMNASEKTIRDTLRGIVDRLCVLTRDEAVAKAKKLGLI